MDPMLPVTREVVWVSFSFFREFRFFQEAIPIRIASFLYYLILVFVVGLKTNNIYIYSYVTNFFNSIILF
jgi:hypothetical protein